MARVLKGSHSYTCTPRVHPLTEWTIPAFASPAEAGTQYSFYRPRSDGRLSWPWPVVAAARIAEHGLKFWQNIAMK